MTDAGRSATFNVDTTHERQIAILLAFPRKWFKHRVDAGLEHKKLSGLLKVRQECLVPTYESCNSDFPDGTHKLAEDIAFTSAETSQNYRAG